MEILAVFIGGGLGACLRYLISLLASKYFNITYWATFFINITGCIFLGFALTYFAKFGVNSNIKLFFTTGIAGGYTTFSTFSLENINLLKDGKILTSTLYMTLSLIIGIIGIYIGYAIADII